MKKLGLLFTLCGLMTLVACQKEAKLDTPKARYSYAVGSQIGRNIKNQKIDLDEKAFTQAVRDQIAGKKARMTEQEIRQSLRAMSDMRNQEKKKEAEANIKIGQDFLEKNKAKDGIEVTKSGLQYKVIEPGKGKSPKDTDVVKVHYKGTLISGKEFDSSYKRDKPAEFPVKAVIPGWTEALQLMKTGAKWQLFIPPELGYGARGNPSIPGNSVLVFDVELLEVLKK